MLDLVVDPGNGLTPCASGCYAAGAMPVTAKGGRVLVIDDDPMVRQTLGQVLTEEGYVVDLAVNGDDALAHVRASCPDAILLDLMMPGMNGRQFLEELRGHSEYARVPVLIMTAVHGLEINLAAVGASEVVEKPFDVDELLNKVALAVYRAQDAEPSPSAPTASTAPPSRDHDVVLIVEQERARLHRLDASLSERGFTVVSMTRPSQLPRLARALRPRAVLLELESASAHEAVRELRAALERDRIALLVYTRRAVVPDAWPDALTQATDDALIAFVEQQG
jgi:DNA-binding response OmpR family regulator